MANRDDRAGRVPADDHLMRTFASVPVGSRVLDICCGRGVHTLPLASLGMLVYACDRVPEHVRHVATELEAILGYMESADRAAVAPPTDTGFDDAFFDWVVAFDPFPDVSDPVDLAALGRESRRILKSGGWLYVSARVDGISDAPKGPIAKLTDALVRAGLELAEDPRQVEVCSVGMVRGIFRRVDAGTPR